MKKLISLNIEDVLADNLRKEAKRRNVPVSRLVDEILAVLFEPKPKLTWWQWLFND